jgi:putative MATE family efflux protein
MQEEVDGLTGREASRGSRSSRDWTKGSILKNLFSLSWPMIVSNSLNVMGPTIDTIWMGRLGPDDLAAVGIAGTIVMVVNSFLMGLFTGLRSMIARYIGASDRPGAVHAAQQAFVVAGVMGAILAVIGILLNRWILSLLGVSETVLDLGSSYMRIQFIGMIAMSMRFTTDGIMQASGDTVNPMKLAVIFRLVHVIISPALIFGWWIFPHMGINGAAITGVVSQSMGTLLGLWMLMSGSSRLRLTWRGYRFDSEIIWRLFKIGIPASVMSFQMQLAQLVMTAFVTPFGTAAVAAHTLCQRIDVTLSMPLAGLGAAAGVLVGQNLGARQAERAEKSGWIALAISEGIMIVISTAIMIWPASVVHIFSSDPGLDAIANTYIRIAAIGYMVASFSMVLQNCITGAGDTLPPMIIGIVIIWAIQIPLSIFLTHGSLGVYGVRWAVVTGALLNMFAYTIYFKLGRWKTRRIY